MSDKLRRTPFSEIIKAINGFMFSAVFIALFLGYILGTESMKVCECQQTCNISLVFSGLVETQKVFLSIFVFLFFGLFYFGHSINKHIFGELKRRIQSKGESFKSSEKLS